MAIVSRVNLSTMMMAMTLRMKGKPTTVEKKKPTDSLLVFAQIHTRTDSFSSRAHAMHFAIRFRYLHSHDLATPSHNGPTNLVLIPVVLGSKQDQTKMTLLDSHKLRFGRTKPSTKSCNDHGDGTHVNNDNHNDATDSPRR